MDGECLGCGTEIDYSEGVCPECGWDPREFRERGRHALEKEGHGEPEEDRSGGGPPGPGGLVLLATNL
jgi:protein PhnA